MIAGSMKGAASAPSEDDESRETVPSAPEDTDPSAPVETFQSAECVVCLERKVFFKVVFDLVSVSLFIQFKLVFLFSV